ncbi:C3 and PZP-like alpha-2-macroglobulin domain-containing protein 8, partial [Clarias magur]
EWNMISWCHAFPFCCYICKISSVVLSTAQYHIVRADGSTVLSPCSSEVSVPAPGCVCASVYTCISG